MSKYVKSGTPDRVSKVDSELEKIQDSINTLLSRDGAAPNQMGANLDMNSYPIINLPSPTSPTSPVRVTDLDAGSLTIETVNITTDTVDNLRTTTPTAVSGDVALVYGYSQAGDFGGSYWQKTATTGEPVSQTPVQRNAYEITDAGGNVWQLISEANPVVLGADRTGSVDSTSAFNLYIATETAKRVDIDLDYLPSRLVFPPGVYSVSSVNMTDLRGSRNIHVEAFGCVLVANTADKVVLDCLASRWLWIRGLTIYSPSGVIAKHGIQIGDKGQETCGNNKFLFVNILGTFSLSCFYNGGSETTQYYSMRCVNRSVDDSTYAAIFDGAAYYVPTSDYATVTKVQYDATSFTQNSHYGCQYRHEGQGSSVFISKGEGHYFDKGCYYLSYNKSNFVFWCISSWRQSDVYIGGLFETGQTAPPAGPTTNGLQYCLVFDGDGSASTFSNLEVDISFGLCEEAVIGFENIGTFRLENFKLKTKIPSNAPALLDLFEKDLGVATTGTISMSGKITNEGPVNLNMNVLGRWSGELTSDGHTGYVPPTSGGFDFNDPVNGLREKNRISDVTFDSWKDVSVSVTDLQVEGVLNTVSPAGASLTANTITNRDIFDTAGLQQVFIRVVGTGDLTITASSNIRTLSGSNIVLSNNECVHFIQVTDGGSAWQQVGGKL